ncbi:MAG TPA: hypothetical protein VGQ99_23970 [Tepidisphaeraceae bacterium]|jgi:hypothetical protein|nr:hypothetical protein [Tepidisphaeraceae bacterium]
MRSRLTNLAAGAFILGVSAAAQAAPIGTVLAADGGDGVMSGAIRGGIIGGIAGGIAGVVVWALKKNKK